MEIIIHPNPILRQKSSLIDVFDDELKKTVKEMEALLKGKDGIGLAAPQVGLAKSIFLVDRNLGEAKNLQDKDLLVFINPRITWRSPEKTAEFEGCLSLPGLEGRVTRPKKIRIKAQGTSGEKFSLEAKDWLARVIQHENDHLSGILYIDYIKSKKDLRKVD